MAIGRKNTIKKSYKITAGEVRSKIEQKAYELWQKRGYSHGSDWADWFKAETIVNTQSNK